MSIDTRRAIATRLAQMAATQDGREVLRRIGHRDGNPLIAVAEDDTLREVFSRIVTADPEPPAVIATSRAADPPCLMFLVLFPIASVAVAAPSDDHHQIGDSSTIGMLLDYLQATDQREISFSLTWGAQRAELVEA